MWIQLHIFAEKFESEKKQMERAEKDLEDNIENEFKGKNLYKDMKHCKEWIRRTCTKTWKIIENEFKSKKFR